MVETDKIKSGRIVLGGEGFQKRYNKCCWYPDFDIKT